MPVGNEFVPVRRMSALLEIPRRSAEDALNIGKLADSEIAVLRLAEEEGEIEALRRQVDLAIGQAQPDAHLRVQIQEFRDLRRNKTTPDTEWCSDVERPLRVFRDVDHLGFGIFDRLENRASPAVKRPALLGRRQASRRALKEADAEMFFQLRNARGCHSRRNPEIAPGGGHAA